MQINVQCATPVDIPRGPRTAGDNAAPAGARATLGDYPKRCDMRNVVRQQHTRARGLGPRSRRRTVWSAPRRGCCALARERGHTAARAAACGHDAPLTYPTVGSTHTHKDALSSKNDALAADPPPPPTPTPPHPTPPHHPGPHARSYRYCRRCHPLRAARRPLTAVPRTTRGRG